MNRDSKTLLGRAVTVSRELLAAADRGDTPRVLALDAERLLLLKSVRRGDIALDADDTLLLQEVALLNDRSIGHLEHHRRIKERQMEVAAVGRHAVNAYGAHRRSR